MLSKRLQEKLNVYFSVGSILLLAGILVMVVVCVADRSFAKQGQSFIIIWYLFCMLVDYYLKNHLLFDQNLHNRLKEKEKSILFERFSQSQIEQLVDWYAQWLALFTGTFGRLLDLCAFQVAGTSMDLLKFQHDHQLMMINDTGIQELVSNLNLSDEQVFKIYYGSRIKRRAFKYLRKMHGYHKQKLQSQYLDQLLDTYGKSYYEYGIFLIKRLCAGDDVRSLYDGLVEYHVNSSNSVIDRVIQQKYLLQSSVMSLKDILQKKKP